MYCKTAFARRPADVVGYFDFREADNELPPSSPCAIFLAEALRSDHPMDQLFFAHEARYSAMAADGKEDTEEFARVMMTRAKPHKPRSFGAIEDEARAACPHCTPVPEMKEIALHLYSRIRKVAHEYHHDELRNTSFSVLDAYKGWYDWSFGEEVRSLDANAAFLNRMKTIAMNGYRLARPRLFGIEKGGE